MRNLCLVFAFTSGLALAAGPAPNKGAAKTVPDSVATKAIAPAPAPSPVPASTAAAPAPSTLAPSAPVAPATPVDSLDTAATATARDSGAAADTTTSAGPGAGSSAATSTAVLSPPSPSALPSPSPSPSPNRALFPDASLVAREYLFGILGQTVAGALGFFIGSAIETAIVGDEDAHKGTLSFKGLRYDNYYGAFWGGTTGALMGSSLTVYFTGQSDEEDGALIWTLAGTAMAGAGALYAAHLMGVNDDVDWKPFLPLLAIPSLGGVAGFNVSRWFSDRRRESIMGPDAGLTLYPPRLAWGRTADGDRFHLQALNLGF